ncbi:polysaccharide biosynthesis protein [Sinimarinibacterium thermocellulolyticum]|uniref:Nucleoside-diphosphate sugar epimerase/dehydratase n=1 Tax=Sinimarinibacterium thermocellulolyticum TaxID=3170016 RepID=A0ABV2A7S5_9GAMM
MSAPLRRLAQRLIALDARVKLLIVVIVDWAILTLSAIVAVEVTSSRPLFSGPNLNVLLFAPPLGIALLYLLRSYRTVIRFVGSEFAERAAVALALALALLRTLHHLHDDFRISLATLGFFGLIAFAALVLARAAARAFLRGDTPLTTSTRVLIYGAGAAGAQLASALRIGREYKPVAFADDRADLRGRMLLGLAIYAPADLPRLKARGVFDLVLLAIPSLAQSRKREILESLEKMAVKVLVMPSLDDIASGRKRIHDLREVQIEDLLARDPVPPIPELLSRFIDGKSVMITGAGGSIGSELCRQALDLGAKRLVLFEMSEYGLYAIDRELRERPAAERCEIVPVLASVLDPRALEDALRRHGVETVYHAAAYKHVPLVEANVVTAVRNNVIGTKNVIDAAVSCGVRNFVLVSTDKAVRPTNVMGASKRVCEMLVQAAAQEHPGIRMSIVRFGNVLASSGSVVPLFKEQIARGGPVTVTHPQVTRYFMTIPEAAQLVIQAGAMGRHGEVFVLDMGEPVKIRDLAERMIHLSGLTVRDPVTGEGDIEIRYTGLRPGEKLYEELLIGDRTTPSNHPRIRCAFEEFPTRRELDTWLRQVGQALGAGDSDQTIVQLRRIVPGFVTPTLLPGAVRQIANALPSDQPTDAAVLRAPTEVAVLRPVRIAQ